MKRDLRFEFVYPYPPERVWRALTDPKALAEWLMENDFEARMGHEFQFRTKPAPGFDGIVRCKIVELDPPKRLSYSWEGGGMSTKVTFALEAVPGGTRLRLEHKGFEGVKAMMVSFILGSGWRKKILRTSLPAALARLDRQSDGSQGDGL